MNLSHIDKGAFARDLQALHKEVAASVGEEDLRHAKRIDIVLKLMRVAGLATAWIMINPVSILLLCMANTGRWAMLGHHVGHGAYDKIPGVPKRLHSMYFAKGYRRYFDWLDWLLPGAWEFEHNFLHHYHTGEPADPDFPQRNVQGLRNQRRPMWIKYLYAFFLAATWKFLYYAPNTLWYLEQKRRSNAHLQKVLAHEAEHGRSFPGARIYRPTTAEGRKFWTICILPYLTVNFILTPALFLLISPQAALFVLINLLIAEVLANLHSFTIIVTNHAGEDIPCFDTPISSKSEFYLRQVIGSVNYTGGHEWSDFLQGYANYQIEHHLWPRLTMLRYRKLQPHVEALCRKHGVPYVRENVFIRLRKLLDIMVGKTRMHPVQTA
jgi:fatty acid desaturase